MALHIAPCPFCGSQNLHLVVHGLTHSISCLDCRCRGPQKASQTAALLHWNNTKHPGLPEKQHLPSHRADDLRTPDKPEPRLTGTDNRLTQ